MTARAPAGGAASALERPPQIVGFALYVVATGLLIMGVAQVLLFAMFQRVGWNASVAVRWGMPVGELMTALGLTIAWRTVGGSSRRLVAVAAALWATLFVLELERAPIRSYVLEQLPRAANATYVASWVGWSIALGLVAVVVFRAGRVLAARTWATLLGVALVTAHAFEQALPIVVPPRGGAPGGPSVASGLVALGGLGLVVYAGGLYAAGKNLLGGDDVDERPRSPAKQKARSDDAGAEVWTRAARGGLVLLIDAAVTLSGLVAALALAITFAGSLRMSARDLSSTASVGGELVAAVLLVVALRRLGGPGAVPARFASGVLALLVTLVVLLALSRSRGWRSADELLGYLRGGPPLLAACAMWSAATALGSLAARPPAMAPLRSRLRGCAVALAAAGTVLPFAAPLAEGGGRGALSVLAALGGALALTSAIGAAREGQRIEVAFGSPGGH